MELFTMSTIGPNYPIIPSIRIPITRKTFVMSEEPEAATIIVDHFPPKGELSTDVFESTVKLVKNLSKYIEQLPLGKPHQLISLSQGRMPLSSKEMEDFLNNLELSLEDALEHFAIPQRKELSRLQGELKELRQLFNREKIISTKSMLQVLGKLDPRNQGLTIRDLETEFKNLSAAELETIKGTILQQFHSNPRLFLELAGLDGDKDRLNMVDIWIASANQDSIILSAKFIQALKREVIQNPPNIEKSNRSFRDFSSLLLHKIDPDRQQGGISMKAFQEFKFQEDTDFNDAEIAWLCSLKDYLEKPNNLFQPLLENDELTVNALQTFRVITSLAAQDRGEVTNITGTKPTKTKKTLPLTGTLKQTPRLPSNRIPTESQAVSPPASTTKATFQNPSKYTALVFKETVRVRKQSNTSPYTQANPFILTVNPKISSTFPKEFSAEMTVIRPENLEAVSSVKKLPKQSHQSDFAGRRPFSSPDKVNTLKLSALRKIIELLEKRHKPVTFPEFAILIKQNPPLDRTLKFLNNGKYFDAVAQRDGQENTLSIQDILMEMFYMSAPSPRPIAH